MGGEIKKKTLGCRSFLERCIYHAMIAAYFYCVFFIDVEIYHVRICMFEDFANLVGARSICAILGLVKKHSTRCRQLI